MRILGVHRVLRRRLNERLDATPERRASLIDRICELAEARSKVSHAATTDKALRVELTPLLAPLARLRMPTS